jgi:hypothetical protein
MVAQMAVSASRALPGSPRGCSRATGSRSRSEARAGPLRLSIAGYDGDEINHANRPHSGA